MIEEMKRNIIHKHARILKEKTGTDLTTPECFDIIRDAIRDLEGSNDGNRMYDTCGSNYRDELLIKLDSMKDTANKRFTEIGVITARMVIDNVKVHVAEIYKKHYR